MLFCVTEMIQGFLYTVILGSAHLVPEAGEHLKNTS